MYRNTLIISLIAIPLWLGAQTADEYFHGGAQHYVFGEKQKAQEQVVTGLQQFPQDEKLNALVALLKKEEEQKQQQQQQQKDNEQKKDQKKEEQKSQQQNKPDQNKDQKEQKQQQNQENKDQQQQDKKDEQKQPNQAQKDKSAQKDEREQAAQVVPGQMTPQQAKQLLDAQKAEELMVPIRPEVKPKEHAGPLKDW